MPEFHKLTIKEVKQETADAVSIHFDIPADNTEAYRYKPGQYLTIKVQHQGEELRRAYSLCSSPYVDDVPAIAIKRVDGGRVSNLANDDFKAGMSLDVMTPMGNFTTELNEFYARHFVLYAGGSGITPMMSLLKSILEIEPSSHVTLLYGNRDEDSIIFRKELDELEGHFADRFSLIHCLEKPSSFEPNPLGQMNVENVKSLLSKVSGDLSAAQHFICGPGPMMENVKNALSDLSIPEDKVHIEYFTSKIDQGESTETAAGQEDEAPFTGVAEVKVELQGDEFSVKVKEKDTILQAGLEAGIDPPFACQMGICTTCRAKITQGKVEMEETEGLTQEELDENYILTCQAHPKSNNITIRYE